MRVKAIVGILLLVIVLFLSFKFFPTSPATVPTSPAVDTTLPAAEQFYQKILKQKLPVSSKLQHLEQQVNAKQAFDHKDWYSARSGFMRVIAEDPQDFQAWIFFIQSLKALKEIDPNSNYAAEYSYALLKAQQLAQNTADKHFLAQIETAPDEKIKARLENLLAVYPTEFAPYFLDIPQQADNGTACVSWTYPLLQNRDFHYEDYINLHPKVTDLGVIARGNKLCLEGLDFGANYQLTFKKGFAGKPDVKLEQDQSMSLYIPHRKPSIRFRERGYILPSFGQQVVPFIAINVPKVQVRIVHIPERNIQSVQNNWFSNQIGRWEIDSISEEYGELIWEGTYYCESEVNKTGISGFPIDKMLGKNLQPGVYVIEARVNDNSYDSNEFSSQALIVSDIGLSTYKGPEGLYIMARELHSAKILANVQITLIAKNNRELATAQTNSEGLVHFTASLINGMGGNAPAFLTASLHGKQFTVLNLRNEPFDLSDRGAQGRPMNGPIEAYVYSERGIYRPGETVHLMSLLRQANGNAQTQVPLTLMIYRPDGVLAQTTVLKDAGAGSYQLDYSINSAAPTGMWTAAVYLDPNSDEMGRTSFEVHDFVPPRIEVKAHAAQNSVTPHQNNPIDVSAQYYFGAPGSDLKVEAESLLTKAQQPFPQWSEYQFGLEEETWAPLRFTHEETTTNAKGQATINSLVDLNPQTSQLLELTTQVTVLEVGGRGQIAKQVTQYWHQPFAIGIKPRFKDQVVPNNTKASFDLIAVNQQGELQSKTSLLFTLYAEQQDFIWFRSGNQWQYEMVTRDRVVNNGKLNLTPKEPSLLEVPVESGLYRLEILDEKTGIATSLRFSAGWPYTKGSPDKPDMLDLKFEQGKVFIKSPFAGELCLAIAGQTFQPIYSGNIGLQGITLDLSALKTHLETGGYLIGTVYRPADVKTAQMPARAIGVTWVTQQDALSTHKITFDIDVPARVKSNSTVEVKIKVPSAHRKMRVSAALVDEATLSLIQFKTPDPFEYFFAQKELAFELRDSYGFLINPFGARPGSFEEGADGSETVFSPRALTKLPTRSYKIVSLFSGIVEANDKDILTLPFTIPEFSGKLRLMVVAWDEKGLGKAEGSLLVRDDVDVYFVLPRFLAPKDKTSVPLVLRNLDGQAGEYNLTLQTEKQDFQQKILLQKNEEKRIPMDLSFDTLGVKPIRLTLTGPNHFALSRSWEISVRPPVQSIATAQFGTLEPNQTLTLDANIFNNFQPQTSQSALTIGSVPDFSRSQLIKELESYPYLCLEQTTSRMLATAFDPKADKSNLSSAFNQLSSLQKIDGSFGLWSSIGLQEPWLSLYAADVMQILDRAGITVPTALTENLSQWLNEMEQSQNTSLLAYTSYLNAKAGKNTLGTLSYFAKTHQQQVIAKSDAAFIAAAFAYYGEPHLSALWFDKAIAAASVTEDRNGSSGFGSELRDMAILVSLLAETTQHHPKLFELAQTLSAKANDQKYLSTQEKAWLIRASTLLQDIKREHHVSLNNQTIQGNTPWQKNLTAADLKNPLKLINKGQSAVFYSLATQGDPIAISRLNQQGFEIEREIYTFAGQKAELQHLKSGERYFVILKGKRLKKDLRHILLVDLLPAGFEIEEPNLLKDNLSAAFPWLESLTVASRVEGRDDRFISAYEFDQQSDFVAAYLVRAVSKGTFIYPAVYVEAMYQPQNFKYGKEQTIHIE